MVEIFIIGCYTGHLKVGHSAGNLRAILFLIEYFIQCDLIIFTIFTPSPNSSQIHHIHPLLTPPRSTLCLLSKNTLFFIFLYPPRLIYASHLLLAVWPSIGEWSFHQGL